MRKKVVFLPYDFDTALGINNEGALVFGYNLEDTDHLTGGANVYNGQDSVLWNNLRDAFGAELKAMYQTLRSQGKWSYNKVEKAFEEHQGKWGEAVFNEDAWFKYLAPLVEKGSGAYLSMLQGSKEEQRKWWMYNRFRYMDSKYNAGDALRDIITIRGYQKANITVTPYADVYATVKYGSYVVQNRAARNVAITVLNPLDSENDTEIMIYSASQLKSVGDLSPHKVGYADFSSALKLQDVKLGDADANYTNPNLTFLSLGNNVLLKTVDVRNCTALGTGDQKSVDLSGCSNIENVYFDGTAITSVTLPNGGFLKVLHLPGSITSLVIRNQPGITNLTVPSYANISTLWLDNVSSAVPMEDIVAGLPSDSRVRLVGIDITMASVSDVEDFFDTLDDMRGLDEYGNNLPDAVCTGHIHISDSVTAAEIAGLRARFSDVTFSADHITAILRFYNYNGTTLYTSQTIQDGGDGYYPGSTPTRTGDVAGTYTFIGWSREQSAEVADPNALLNVLEDRDVYAAFSRVPAKYTVTFNNDNNSTVLQTLYNVEYGTTPVYTGATPVSTIDAAFPFEGWTPPLGPITGNTTYVAKYDTGVEDVEITDTWEQIVAYCNAGTAADRYKVGNWKDLDLGTDVGVLRYRVHAVLGDELTNGNGAKAQLTFVPDNLTKLKHRWNPQLQTNYLYPERPSWINRNNNWESQNYNSGSDGTATWTITATSAGTLTIGYKTNNGGSSFYGNLKLSVDGNIVESSYIANVRGTTTVECTANQTVLVSATYHSNDQRFYDSNYYATIDFTSTGTFTVNAQIQDAPYRVKDGYVSGTGSIGGYSNSELNDWMENTLIGYFPSNLLSAIKQVNKYTTTYDTSGTKVNNVVSAHYLWAPSAREVGINNNETEGPSYAILYPDNNSRKKIPYEALNPDTWWLRTGNSHDIVDNVYTNGGASASYAKSAMYLAPGFCL